jgi:hypothetical protein
VLATQTSSCPQIAAGTNPEKVSAFAGSVSLRSACRFALCCSAHGARRTPG